MVISGDAYAPAAAGSLAELAAALGVDEPQAQAVLAFGHLVTQRAAQALTQVLAQPVALEPVALRRMDPAEVEQEDWGSYHPIDVRWQIDGETFAPVLLLPQAELQTLLPAARGGADLPDMEALGRVLRDLAGQLSEALQTEVTPAVRLWLPDANEPPHDPGQPVLRVEHTLSAGHPGMQAQFTVVHLVPVAALRAIAQGAAPASAHALSGEPDASSDAITEPTSHPASTGGEGREMENNMASTQAATSVHGVQFQSFDGEGDPAGGTNLDLLLDVSLKVSVELGRTELAIKEVLALGPGSVVELDKLAGEPVDILVNNRLIAKGEVVVVDENFGVRVTDIISPQKLLGKLR